MTISQERAHTAARIVAGWFIGENDHDPSDSSIQAMIAQYDDTLTRSDIAPIVRQVRYYLADPSDRANATAITVAQLTEALRGWPAHALVAMRDVRDIAEHGSADAPGRIVTDVDISTSHEPFTQPVLLLTLATQD